MLYKETSPLPFVDSDIFSLLTYIKEQKQKNKMERLGSDLKALLPSVVVTS